METPSGVTEETNKLNFAFNSFVLGCAVVLGVVGYIYFSMDKKLSDTIKSSDVN